MFKGDILAHLNWQLNICQEPNVKLQVRVCYMSPLYKHHKKGLNKALTIKKSWFWKVFTTKKLQVLNSVIIKVTLHRKNMDKQPPSHKSQSLSSQQTWICIRCLEKVKHIIPDGQPKSLPQYHRIASVSATNQTAKTKTLQRNVDFQNATRRHKPHRKWHRSVSASGVFFFGAVQSKRSNHIPYHPCMVYLPTYGWFWW